MIGKNKKVDVVGVILLCIAMASTVSGRVDVTITKCDGGKCETQHPKGGESVVVEVVVSPGGEKGESSTPSSNTEKGESSTPSSNTEKGESNIKKGETHDIEAMSKPSDESIKILCEGSMYKEACSKILSELTNGAGSTEEVIKAAATLALKGIEKILGIAESYKPKTTNELDLKGETMATDDCKTLFQDSVEQLKEAINQMGDPESYKTPCTSFTLRMWLSDVLTYAETCMDVAKETGSTNLHDVLKDGVLSAQEITMVTLDVFTGFAKVMSAIGINPSNIVDSVKGYINPTNEKAGRRLLGGPTEMLGDDGVPRWLSSADRRLLNIDGDRHERFLDNVIPNAVVAKDGSGQFNTITDALNAYDPKNAVLPPGGKYIIYVKEGVYDELIVIKNKKDIFMYGDGPTRTIVTGKVSFEPTKKIGTMNTATFSAASSNFFCKDMGFENTAGAKGHQAVAFRSNGEQHVLLNCHFNGYQDTLYVQSGTQFFRDCLITGTIDFIFGNGATVIQHSEIVVRQPLPNQFNAVTAHGRTGHNMPTGIVIHDCHITNDPLLDKANIKTYLGRPWKQYARTVFMESNIEDLIIPEGYRPFDGAPEGNTVDSIYGEYMNYGPGAFNGARVEWPGIKRNLSPEEAQTYTVAPFLTGSDVWIPATGAPFYPGFRPV